MDEPSKAAASDDDLRELRDQLYRKLGWCMVRLHQVELGMKWLASSSHMTAPAGHLLRESEKRQERIFGQTLGTVADVVAKQVLVPPNWEPQDGQYEDPAPRVGSGFTIELPDVHRDAVASAMKELVERRNFLVHGFIQKYDIWTLAGCVAADAYLDAALTFVDARLEDVRQWVKDLGELGLAFAGLLDQPEFQDAFFHGILPDGDVVWRGSTIVQLLRAAEDAFADDGWTSLANAIAFAHAKAPEHTPRRYGCSTWRQVLHESGQFELRRRASSDSGEAGTWYRSLNP